MSAPWIAAFACLWVLVIGLALVVAGVLRKVATALDAVPADLTTQQMPAGPPLGSTLPPLEVQRADGSLTSLASLAGPFVAAVLTSHCSPCLSVADRLRADPATLAGLDGLVVITDPEGPQRLDLGPPVTVLVDLRGEVMPVLQLPGTPFAIAVGTDGTVRSAQLLAGPSQLASMLDSVRPSRIAAPQH